MIREIVKDIIFLQQKAQVAEKTDHSIATDLKDTLIAHADSCVGLAANMIGFTKAIIVFKDGKDAVIMYNPKILSAVNPYHTEEGCLSLPGKRPCLRYEHIEVKYRDETFHVKKKKFNRFTAEIIQHEIDHLKGILI